MSSINKHNLLYVLWASTFRITFEPQIPAGYEFWIFDGYLVKFHPSWDNKFDIQPWEEPLQIREFTSSDYESDSDRYSCTVHNFERNEKYNWDQFRPTIMDTETPTDSVAPFWQAFA